MDRWRAALEGELAVAVEDALMGGPASPDGVAAAERNMRGVLDRWLRQGKLPDVKAYHLRVSGGAGLSVDLDFEYIQRATEVNVHLAPREEDK